MNSGKEKSGGRVVLVTGAGSGIGAATARVFAEAGDTVICCGRRLQACAETVRTIQQHGGTGEAIALDIRDSEAVDETVARVVENYGRLDVLVANAGVVEKADFSETSDEMLQSILDTNVQGTFACCRAAYRSMLPRGQGTIITIGSVVSHKGYPEQSAYAASKHAILGFTRSLCVEAQKHGIRVACVMPGGVATEMVRQARPDLDEAGMIRPEDVASAVRYLSDLPGNVAIDSICLRRWNASPM